MKEKYPLPKAAALAFAAALSLAGRASAPDGSLDYDVTLTGTGIR